MLLECQLENNQTDNFKINKKTVNYFFLITIDGQSVTWDVSGKTDNTPLYDANGWRTIECWRRNALLSAKETYTSLRAP